VPVRAVLTIAALALVLVPAATAGRSSGGIVSVRDLGTGAAEVWVLLPDRPPTCVVTFVHAAGDATPDNYLPWMNYLALDKKCAVIFPRYEATAGSSLASQLRGLRAGIKTGLTLVHGSSYGLNKSPASEQLPMVVAGFGYGATLALHDAADAGGWGLPIPAAVDGVFPVAGTAADLPKGSLPSTTRVLVEVGDRDTAGGRAGGRFVFGYLAAHAAGKKRLIVVHSSARLTADGKAPFESTPAAEETFWPRLDGLINTAR
jgi:hypothetical protein